MLSITNLSLSVGNKEILHNLNLKINKGEVHAVMGPNGSGKSSLAYAIVGHPTYKVQNPKSKIQINKKNITRAEPEERAKLGLFLAFQNPIAIPGVRVSHFLRQVYKTVKDSKVNFIEFQRKLENLAVQVGIDKIFLDRSLNDGFSGGEKKKLEMLQLMVLEPMFIIIDEIDTGLDIDSLKTVASMLNNYVRSKQKPGVLIISHYQRIFNYIKPDFVHVLIKGKIVKTGNFSLIDKIEKKGYAGIYS